MSSCKAIPCGEFPANSCNIPWCWPQVWGMNRDQISNPHWIYPGQIVYFDRVAGRLRLGTPTGDFHRQSGGSGRILRMSVCDPQTRTMNLGGTAISSIPSNIIEPFLSRPLIVGENDLKDTPHIVATQEGRVMLGKGDRAYVRGDLKGETSFQVFRPGAPLKDPETNKILGYEAIYLGTAKLNRAAKTPNEANTFTVISAKEEMGGGRPLAADAAGHAADQLHAAPAAATNRRPHRVDL